MSEEFKRQAGAAMTAIAEITRQVKELERSGGEKAAAASGTTRCPLCGAETLRWLYRGPRAIRMACSTPNCLRMIA